MRKSLEILGPLPPAVQADEVGYHIITMTGHIPKKLPLLGTGLAEMSLDGEAVLSRLSPQPS